MKLQKRKLTKRWRTGVSKEVHGDNYRKVVVPFFVLGGEKLAEIEKVIALLPDDGLLGRRKILTDKKEVTEQNVVQVISNAMSKHNENCREINYLYDYYRGKQDIRCKQKQVRPEINNKVVVNIANEIVTFKTAYFLSGAIQYVSESGEQEVSEQVKRLNEFMRAEDKESKDKEICDWIHICGVADRLVLPDPEGEENECPFLIHTLDPREAFVIYYSGIGQKPLAGVILQKDEEGRPIICVYTKNRYYEIQNDKVAKSESHALGGIPLIEYVNNNARIGAFEIVLSLLNHINTLESNRVDNVADFVNAYDVFQNCEISDETYKKLAQGGQAIEIKNSTPGMESKVYRIYSELSQSGVQTAIDDLTDKYILIVGMPNRNGGSSTSDTGVAVTFRDGWEDADSRANDTEKVFDRSEKEFTKIALNICAATTDINLRMSQIKIEHPRNNLSNMQSRMQILCEGLNNEKIHPLIPWILAGIPNAQERYSMSMKHYEEEQEKMQRGLEDETDEESVPAVG